MKIRILILFLTISSTLLQGQEQFLPDKPIDFQNIFLTHTIFPLPNTDSSRVDFSYFIPHEFLIYTRDTDTSYRAQCEITLELKNLSTSRTEIRQIQNRDFKKIDRSDYPTDGSLYLSGMFSFKLSPGKYRIFFEVRDIESARTFKENKTEFEVPFPQKPFSDILFVERFDTARILSSKIYNVSYKNIIPFDKKFFVYFELDKRIFPQSIPEVELFDVTDSRREKLQVPQNYKILSFKRLVPNLDSANYSFEENPLYDGILIFLPLNKLNIGDYELIIKHGQDKQTMRKLFQIKWINMPKSLRDFRLAIDLLEYIATPEEIREMKIMNIKSAKEKFETFWQKFDPTPETTFNEAMAEYYNRADHATEQFTTIKGDLGAKTDRGKIYILYGSPSKIERMILPRTTPKEIWIYSRLSKKFIFEDKNLDGNYKLTKIENL